MTRKKPIKKNSLFPIAYDEISLVDEGAAGSAHVLIAKADTVERVPKKKKLAGGGKVNGSSGECSSCKELKETNSTGAKTGKSSNRAKNWKEERHPRDSKGKMKSSTADSKKAYGKKGTTKAKLESKCKNCRKKKKGGSGAISGVAKNNARPVVNKSAMSSWDATTRIRAIMERK